MPSWTWLPRKSFMAAVVGVVSQNRSRSLPPTMWWRAIAHLLLPTTNSPMYNPNILWPLVLNRCKTSLPPNLPYWCGLVWETTETILEQAYRACLIHCAGRGEHSTPSARPKSFQSAQARILRWRTSARDCVVLSLCNTKSSAASHFPFYGAAQA